MNILVIGGTRYFGKRLVNLLIQRNYSVTIVTRGLYEDDLGDRVNRLVADRRNPQDLRKAIGSLSFDAVVDQVCMNGTEAQDAISIFQGKTSYYLMTSTLSVYEPKANLAEEDFIAESYLQTNDSSYAGGKRRAEHVFATSAPFPTAFARFPIVLGPDDYTQRLELHIQNVKRGEGIYFPNLEAKFSFISSEDAARALLWLVENKHKGSFNFASSTPMTLKDLMKLIETKTGKSAIFSQDPNAVSPFGIEKDYFMDVSKALKLGFKTKDLKDWLPDLIK
ncbi:NAD-dependent epimerase/dehydratase family protein [Peredibacter sp. HCB2-198]|uniref:NAD-dependent epimerase/dehydratase family protein n=1 Tax=Peredibacter sp. HCB2-198 TaxID=3383025 RepID=UPI0038B6A9B1